MTLIRTLTRLMRRLVSSSSSMRSHELRCETKEALNCSHSNPNTVDAGAMFSSEAFSRQAKN